MNLEKVQQNENNFIDNFLNNYVEIDNNVIDNFLNDWNRIIFDGNEISFNSKLSDKFVLIPGQIQSLKRLRYGIVDKSISSSIEVQGIKKNIENGIENGIEYGGHISENINLKFIGKDGAIENFESDINSVNFHTHPTQLNKWPYAPPSELDLTFLVQECIKLNNRIVSLIAAAEGIYVYYLSDELFQKLFQKLRKDKSLSHYLSQKFQDVKLLLGYVKSGPESIKEARKSNTEQLNTDNDTDTDTDNNIISPKRLFFGGVDSPKNNFNYRVTNMTGENTPLKNTPLKNTPLKNTPLKNNFNYQVTNMTGKITIEDYIFILQKMGIYISLYSYDSDRSINLPINVPDKSEQSQQHNKTTYPVIYTS